jgi:hypothetical protein
VKNHHIDLDKFILQKFSHKARKGFTQSLQREKVRHNKKLKRVITFLSNPEEQFDILCALCVFLIFFFV